MRYTPSTPSETVSQHEQELLLKVVEGHKAPKKRDHKKCNLEVEVVEHHGPDCPDRKRHTEQIRAAKPENAQGSFLIIDRIPINIDTCKGKHKNEVNKFTLPDDHVMLRGSRKGTNLNNPDAFKEKPLQMRNVIENVALLPKLGCNKGSFVARMEHRPSFEERFKPTASQYVYSAHSKGKSPFNEKQKKLVYKDVSGKPISVGDNPFDTDDKRQSVYAIVSKPSRISYSEAEIDSSTSKTTVDGKSLRSDIFSVNGVTFSTFKDPCFLFNESIVMAAPDISASSPFDANNKEMSTMTSFVTCCPQTYLAYNQNRLMDVFGKPQGNFTEESSSDAEEELNSSRAPNKQGFFKRVILCGACGKKASPSQSDKPPAGRARPATATCEPSTIATKTSGQKSVTVSADNLSSTCGHHPLPADGKRSQSDYTSSRRNKDPKVPTQTGDKPTVTGSMTAKITTQRQQQQQQQQQQWA